MYSFISFFRHRKRYTAASKGVGSGRQCCVKFCNYGKDEIKEYMETYCSIHGREHGFCPCEPPIKLIPLPRDPEHKAAYVRCINRNIPDTNKPWKPNKDTRICTKHFQEGHPYPILEMGHENIPPKYMLPKRKAPRDKTETVTKRQCTSTDSNQCTSTDSNQSSSNETEQNLGDTDSGSESRKVGDHSYNNKHCENCILKDKLIKVLKNQLSTQNQSNNTKILTCDNARFHSDNKISLYTGIPKRKTFDALYQCVKERPKRCGTGGGHAVRPINNCTRKEASINGRAPRRNCL